jgi:hypothetical protein
MAQQSIMTTNTQKPRVFIEDAQLENNSRDREAAASKTSAALGEVPFSIAHFFLSLPK